MNILDSLFGRTVSPAERLRQHQRTIQRAQREIDRERTKLEQNESRVIAGIRRNAKAGNIAACKIQARDLVRTRRYVQKFRQMHAHLSAVSLRMQTLRSTEQMAVAMRGATRAIGAMNRSLNLPQIQRVMNQFEKESSIMDMKEEMMGDAIDDAVGDEEGEGEEEEGDRILKEVLDEIGIGLGQSLVSAPTGGLPLARVASPLEERVAIAEGGATTPPPPRPSPGGFDAVDIDLEHRLILLRGGAP